MKLTISIKGTSDGNNEKSNDFRKFLTHPCDREGKISIKNHISENFHAGILDYRGSN